MSFVTYKTAPVISFNPHNSPVGEVDTDDKTETWTCKVTCSKAVVVDRYVAQRPPQFLIPKPCSLRHPRQLSPLPLEAPISGLWCSPPSNVAFGSSGCAESGCGNHEFSRISGKCIFRKCLTRTAQLPALVHCPSQKEQRSPEESKCESEDRDKQVTAAWASK